MTVAEFPFILPEFLGGIFVEPIPPEAKSSLPVKAEIVPVRGIAKIQVENHSGLIKVFTTPAPNIKTQHAATVSHSTGSQMKTREVNASVHFSSDSHREWRTQVNIPEKSTDPSIKSTSTGTIRSSATTATEKELKVLSSMIDSKTGSNMLPSNTKGTMF